MLNIILPYFSNITSRISNRANYFFIQTRRLMVCYALLAVGIFSLWISFLGTAYFALLYLSLKPLMCFFILFMFNLLLTLIIYRHVKKESSKVYISYSQLFANPFK